MNTKRLTIAIAALLTGCASYTHSKINLTTQAQQGVAVVRTAVDSQRGRSNASADALRSRLDAAFDADVATRSKLDADWVIAHRKAYALAADAFDADRRAADASDAATLRTLDAIAAVLSQLQQMHAAELRLTLPDVTLPEVKR